MRNHDEDKHKMTYNANSLSESTVEDSVLEWLKDLGWQIAHPSEIIPNEIGGERSGYDDVVLNCRLCDALSELNPLPVSALIQASQEIMYREGSSLEARNRQFRRSLIEGVDVYYYDYDDERYLDGIAKVVDFDNYSANDWLAVSRFTVKENRKRYIADIVLFVNGLPLVVFGLINPVDEKVTVWSAFRQLQTHKSTAPSLFAFNLALVISDGLEARIGTLTAGKEWFKPWRTTAGEKKDPANKLQLKVLIDDIFEPSQFLALLRDFIMFEDDGNGSLVSVLRQKLHNNVGY